MKTLYFKSKMKIKACVGSFFDDLLSEIEKNESSGKPDETDLICLKMAIVRFLDTGIKDDAFDIFFCFTEIFEAFGKGYGGVERMLSLLADHEMNTGALVAEHRDHYSHSAYVFSLGLALFETTKIKNLYKNDIYRGEKYGELMEFLYRWGMASLFHDVGYPYEIASKSIKEYGKSIFGSENPSYPLVTYVGIDDFIKFDKNEKEVLHGLLGFDSIEYTNANELLLSFADSVSGESRNALHEHITDGANSKEYTDHGYFSAILILKLFLKNATGDKRDFNVIIESAIAALIHNGYKYRIRSEKKFRAEKNAIVFLLMLCDDLQTFDRQGYGKTSKGEPLPRDCFLDPKTEGGLSVVYAYPETAIEYMKHPAGSDKKEAKEYIIREMSKLNKNLGDTYDLENLGGLSVDAEINNIRTKGTKHNSVSYFKNIFKIAVNIHMSYLSGGFYNTISESWDELTLEYKMSNILQAKSYANKLNKIHCFYDNDGLMLEKVEELTKKEIEIIARDEHERWMREKKDMGWEYAEYDAGNKKIKDEMRSKRKHNCLVDYDMLSRNDQEKDIDAAKNIIKNINTAGFKVYRMSEWTQKSNETCIGIVGYADYSNAIADRIVKEIHGRFEKDVLLICRCLEFDLKVATRAVSQGIRIKMVMLEREGISSKEMALLEEIKGKKNVEILILPKLDEGSDTVFRYIAANSDTVITVGALPESIAENRSLMILTKAKEYGQNVLHIEAI